MLGNPLVLAPALVGGSLALEAALERRDGRRHPPPGRIVEIGGHGLHARLLGSGDPAIVLEAGAGEWSSHWGRLPEELSRLSTVIAYDRAGLGWSGPGRGARTAGAAAVELRELLRRLAPGRRALLVGHGWGAHVARIFAHRYPFELAGLVLVDGQHEALVSALADAGLPSPLATPATLRRMAILARLGVLRVARPSPFAGLEDVPLAPSQVETIETLWRLPRVLEGMRAELLGAAESDAQVARLEGPAGVPVRALVAEGNLPATGTPPSFPREAFNALWRDLGRRFAELSEDARATVIPGADHLLPLRSPHSVVGAVAEVLEAARGS